MNGSSWGESDLPLGKRTGYVSVYTPSLLRGVSRASLREDLDFSTDKLPFYGFDIWTAYELSWLDMNGKPVVAMAQFQVPCVSDFVVESKSLKLYLNSFSQTKFKSYAEVVQTIESDLSVSTKSSVMVDLHTLSGYQSDGFGHFLGECIDNLDITIDQYQPSASLLALAEDDQEVNEALYSHLLKTNCPVTGQPDWASILIEYAGPKIDSESLLRYIVSYREYQDFHEHCVEKIYIDIMQQCKPRELTVYGRYTRRGGLDINPYRSSSNQALPDNIRLIRQ